MSIFKTTYFSPVGQLQITCSDDALCGVHSLHEKAPGERTQENGIIEITVQQLDEYFSGSSKLFQIPILQNGTAFQTKVWSLQQVIPYGRTVSFIELSKRLADVKAIRAVASANG